MLQRILACFTLLLSLLFMPIWVSVLLALAGTIYFNIFWEATLLFFISDLLFGIRETKNSPIIFISFFVSIIVLLLLEMLKKSLRLNDYKNN